MLLLECEDLVLADERGQSPVEASEYAGLELDTRATNTTERDLDDSRIISPGSDPAEERGEKASMVEVGARAVARSQTTPHLMTSTLDEEMPHAPNAREVKIYGLRRRYFWIIFAMVLILIILAAVVGGVVGALRDDSSASTSSSSGDASSTSNTSSPTSSAAAADATDAGSIAQS